MSINESDGDECRLEISIHHTKGKPLPGEVYVFLEPDFSVVILHGQESLHMDVSVPETRVTVSPCVHNSFGWK